MRADDVGRSVRGRARRVGDQVGDPAPVILVGLLGDGEPRRLESAADLGLGPVEAVAAQHRALADFDAEFADVEAKRLNQPVRGRRV